MGKTSKRKACQPPDPCAELVVRPLGVPALLPSEVLHRDYILAPGDKPFGLELCEGGRVVKLGWGVAGEIVANLLKSHLSSLMSVVPALCPSLGNRLDLGVARSPEQLSTDFGRILQDVESLGDELRSLTRGNPRSIPLEGSLRSTNLSANCTRDGSLRLEFPRRFEASLLAAVEWGKRVQPVPRAILVKAPGVPPVPAGRQGDSPTAASAIVLDEWMRRNLSYPLLMPVLEQLPLSPHAKKRGRQRHENGEDEAHEVKLVFPSTSCPSVDALDFVFEDDESPVFAASAFLGPNIHARGKLTPDAICGFRIVVVFAAPSEKERTLAAVLQERRRRGQELRPAVAARPALQVGPPMAVYKLLQGKVSRCPLGVSRVPEGRRQMYEVRNVCNGCGQCYKFKPPLHPEVIDLEDVGIASDHHRLLLSLAQSPAAAETTRGRALLPVIKPVVDKMQMRISTDETGDDEGMEGENLLPTSPSEECRRHYGDEAASLIQHFADTRQKRAACALKLVSQAASTLANQIRSLQQDFAIIP